MGAENDQIEFAEWLLKLGNGTIKIEKGDDIISIPRCIIEGDFELDLFGNITNLEQLKDICSEWFTST